MQVALSIDWSEVRMIERLKLITTSSGFQYIWLRFLLNIGQIMGVFLKTINLMFP